MDVDDKVTHITKVALRTVTVSRTVTFVANGDNEKFRLFAAHGDEKGVDCCGTMV